MNPVHAELLRQARDARRLAHAPYSRFRVGAALRCADGRVVTAANVENASFGLSICAERAAVYRALAEGERAFTAIAICADGRRPTPPCGACRQVLREFAADLEVILGGEDGPDGPIEATRLELLLPAPFVAFSGAPRRDDEGPA